MQRSALLIRYEHQFEALDLRAFISVVELGGFHRAAEALNMSQPALSRRIQRLEAAVGAALLERTTRRVALTMVGREMLPLVRRMLDEFDSSIFAMRDLGSRRAGQIALACIPTAAFYFLPSVIARFQAQYPNIRFRILDLSANDGLEAVAPRRGRVRHQPAWRLRCRAHLRAADGGPLRAACRRDHALADKPSLAWADLEGHPLVTVSRASGNRAILDAALVRVGVRLDWSFEVTHLSTSLDWSRRGLGISVLPRLATPGEDHAIIETRPIRDPEVSRTIGVVRRRSVRLAPAAERFLEMLLGVWRGPLSG